MSHLKEPTPADDTFLDATATFYLFITQVERVISRLKLFPSLKSLTCYNDDYIDDDDEPLADLRNEERSVSLKAYFTIKKEYEVRLKDRLGSLDEWYDYDSVQSLCQRPRCKYLSVML